jgi:hypothetical protein
LRDKDSSKSLSTKKSFLPLSMTKHKTGFVI